MDLDSLRAQISQLLTIPDLPIRHWQINQLVLTHPLLPAMELSAKGQISQERINMLVRVKNQGWLALELDRLNPRLKMEVQLDVEPWMTQSPFWQQLEMNLLEPVVIRGNADWAFLTDNPVVSNWHWPGFPVQTQLGLRMFPEANLDTSSRWQEDELLHRLEFHSGGFDLQGDVIQGLVDRGYRFNLTSKELGQLSVQFTDWLPPRLNLVQGELGLNGVWGLEQSELNLDVSQILGHYNDIVLADGLLTARLTRNVGAQPVLEQGLLEIGVLDIGVPIKQLRLQLASGQVEEFSGEVFGGTFRLAPMQLARGASGLLYIDGIYLEEMLQYYEFQAVDATGQLDGEVPFILQPGGIQVEQGKLVAREPGGYMRLTQLDALEGAMAGNAALKLAMEVLQDLEYHSLDCDFSYQVNGDFRGKIAVRGRTRSADHEQPINLNYQHEENLLQLLRSLRFSSDIQQTMERWADCQ